MTMDPLLLYTVYGILTFLLIYMQRKCWYFVWQLNGWRGVLKQPCFWIALIIYWDPKFLMTALKRYRKYFQSPHAIIVFNRILVYVDDPVTSESILTAPECLNKPFLFNGFYANKGLLHAKDEQWKIRRKQISPAFSQNTLVNFFDAYNRISNKLKVKLHKVLQGSNHLKFENIELFITQAVLDVSFMTITGYETHLLQNDDKGITQAYKYLMEMSALRSIKFWYQIDFIFRLLDNANYEKWKKANKLVSEFLAKIVQQKQIQWQQHHNQQHTNTTNTKKCNDIVVSDTIATKSPKDTMLLNEQANCNNFSGITTLTASSTAANDATYHANTNEFSEQNMQRQRNFIDQIFYLAQSGKLPPEDILNETHLMIALSFESVSSLVINTLLLLAINRECQMRLRNEIQKILLLSKDNTENKVNATARHHNNTTKSNNKTTSSYTNSTGTSNWDSKTTANVVDVNNCNENNSTREGFDDNGADIDLEVTMEHLLNMPYLDMIINESLRLLTVVPMNIRSASKDFPLNVKRQQNDKFTRTPTTTQKSNISNNTDRKSGNIKNFLYRSSSIIAPKDTIFVLDVFNMQRNAKYWGKNSLNFYPEHFIKKYQQQQREHQPTDKSIKTVVNNQKEEEEEKEKLPTSASGLRHSFDFIPFSKGLRSCIGYRYSNYLSKIILINLISSFEFTTNVQLQDLQFEEGMTLKLRNAEKIRFQLQPVNCTSTSS